MELDPNGRTGRNHTFPYLNFFGNGFHSVEESLRFIYLDAVKGAFWNCQRSAKFRYIYPFSLSFSLSSKWNCAKNCTDSRRKVLKSLRFKHNLKTHKSIFLTIIKSIQKYHFYPRIPTATKASKFDNKERCCSRFSAMYNTKCTWKRNNTFNTRGRLTHAWKREEIPMDRSETYRRRRANVGEGRISIIQAEGRPIRDSSVRWTSVYEEEAGRRLRGPPDPPSTRFLASRLASAPGKRQKISRGAPPAHCRPPKIYSNPLFSDAR